MKQTLFDKYKAERVAPLKRSTSTSERPPDPEARQERREHGVSASL